MQLARILVLLVATTCCAPSVAAQPLAERILGSWRLISIYNENQGVRRYLLGEQPVGLLVFERSGYVSQFFSKPDLPKIAAGNRLGGTDTENREIVQGMISGFGTYAVEGDIVTIRWIGSSYPNRIGTEERRLYRISGDEMEAANPAASVGGTAHARFVRAR